jgi:hypothetical protein
VIRQSEYLPYTNDGVSGDQRLSHRICGEIRAPRSIFYWSGGFFVLQAPMYQEEQMENRELAFTKQAILATTDWDTYQILIRRCLLIRENDIKSQQKPGKL